MRKFLETLYLKSVHKHPAMTLLILFFVLLAVGSQIGKLKFDASSDSLVIEGDPTLALFRDVTKRYGTEDFLIVTYSPKAGLYEQSSLDDLKNIQNDFLALPQVSSVNSIVNVPLLYSPKVSLSNLTAEIKYLKDPEVDRTLAAKEFLSSPIYKGLLVSEDQKNSVIQVNLKRRVELGVVRDLREELRAKQRQDAATEEELTQLLGVEKQYEVMTSAAQADDKLLVENSREILNKYRPNAQVFLGGVTMIANDMLSFIQQDLVVFGSAIFLFIILMLGIVFRQLRWVVLPLLACVACVVLTTGIMAMLGWKLTVISANFVALLLILTLSVTIYLIVRYRELEVLEPEMKHEQRVFEAAREMFQPCLYTTLTTIVAFASLVFSGIRPVIDFGWMMTLGVVVALIMTFIVVPAGMLLWEKSSSKNLATVSTPKVMVLLANTVQSFGKVIVGVALLLLGVSIFGMSQLKVENRFIDYFDKKTEIYKGMELIDSELGGVIPLDILVRKSAVTEESMEDDLNDDFADIEDIKTAEVEGEASTEEDDFSEVSEINADQISDEEDDFADVSTENSAHKASYWFTQSGVAEITKLHNYIDGLEETGKTTSLATLFQVATDILNGGLDNITLAVLKHNVSGEIDSALVKPYLSDEKDEARLTVRIKETSGLNRNDLIKKIHGFMQDEMGYAPSDYDLTGLLVLYNNMLQSLFKSQIQTLGVVFVAVMLMFIVLFRSALVALLGILPNLLAAGLVLGCMGYLGIALDMMTITIAAITVGIGVDTSIHYIYRFKKELAVDGDYLATMHRTHHSIGRAMFYTSSTIIIGFSILMLSNFTPSIYFGFLTAFAMFSAVLGNLLLLPQLILLFKPFKNIA